MLVQREVHDTMLAGVLQNIDEMELAKALELYIEESKPKLLKAGKHRPFKPFKAIRMKVIAFKEQWENIDIPEVNDALIEKSGALAQKYSLKGCDAFQLASALTIPANIFVNSDDALYNAARDSGLTVWDPVDGEFFETSYQKGE